MNSYGLNRLRLLGAASCVVLGLGFAEVALVAPAAWGEEGETIDVLVLYSPGTAERYAGNPATRIHHLFNVTNQAYRDSGVNLEIRPVKKQQVEYPDSTSSITALNDLTYKRHEAFSEVDSLRQQYGADMVLLYRPYDEGHGNCGAAWIGGNNTNGDFSGDWKSYMYSHVSITTCGDYVTAHELGHNMGLNHSHLQDGTGGTLPYALGHGVHNNFVTMMAYESVFNVDSRTGKIYKFSSPDLSCNNLPCGVESSNAVSGADAVSTLKITAPQIARFYPTAVQSNKSSSSENNLAALQVRLEQLQASHNALKKRHREAKKAKIAARKAYRQSLASYQEKLSGYKRQYRTLQKSANSYAQAYSNYLATRASGNQDAISRSYDRLTAARRGYLSSSGRVRRSASNLISAKGGLSVAYADYLDAYERERTVRAVLLETRGNYIAARKEYKNAVQQAV